MKKNANWCILDENMQWFSLDWLHRLTINFFCFVSGMNVDNLKKRTK